jgi:ADP-ribose pyrophosphatase YjhB (NUDIX family)
MPNDKSLAARIRHRVFHTYFRFKRPMTLGVRAVILDGEDRVFMVRHGYVSGWHVPGGGVETGETLLDALKKEAMEEGLIRVLGAPVLHGVFFNRKASRRDHVAVFLVRDFEIVGLRKPDYEIAETGWFPVNALPEGTTEGTRRRIEELFFGIKTSEDW